MPIDTPTGSLVTEESHSAGLRCPHLYARPPRHNDGHKCLAGRGQALDLGEVPDRRCSRLEGHVLWLECSDLGLEPDEDLISRGQQGTSSCKRRGQQRSLVGLTRDLGAER